MDRCKARLLIFSLVVGLVQSAGCEKRPDSAETPAAGARRRSRPTRQPPKASAAGGCRRIADRPRGAGQDGRRLPKCVKLRGLRHVGVPQDPTQERSDTRVNYSVTLQRPNKLRMEFFNGKVICDGKQWCALCETCAGTGRASRGPAEAQHGSAAGRLFPVFCAQRRRAIHCRRNSNCSWKTIRSRASWPDRRK